MEFFLPLTSRWKSLCEISSLPPFGMQFKWTALLGPRPSPPVGAVLGFPVSVACQLTFLRILSLYNVRREFLVFNPPSQLGPGQILLQPLCASQPLEHFTAQQEGFFSLLLFLNPQYKKAYKIVCSGYLVIYFFLHWNTFHSVLHFSVFILTYFKLTRFCFTSLVTREMKNLKPWDIFSCTYMKLILKWQKRLAW